MNVQFHTTALVVADVVSALAILGTLSGMLPPLAALGALTWYVIQVYESDTVQSWIKGHRHVMRRRRIKGKERHGRNHPH